MTRTKKTKILTVEVSESDVRRAKEIDLQIAETVEAYKSARTELLRLPGRLIEFRSRKLWRALDPPFTSFEKWIDFRFRGSNQCVYQYIKIGECLQGVSQAEMIRLGRTRCYWLARLAEEGTRVNRELIDAFAEMKKGECKKLALTKLGLLNSEEKRWVEGFHARSSDYRMIIDGRSFVRKTLGLRTLGEIEATVFRSVIALGRRAFTPSVERATVRVIGRRRRA